MSKVEPELWALANNIKPEVVAKPTPKPAPKAKAKPAAKSAVKKEK